VDWRWPRGLGLAQGMEDLSWYGGIGVGASEAESDRVDTDTDAFSDWLQLHQCLQLHQRRLEYHRTRGQAGGRTTRGFDADREAIG
jgi:hypothetical protein